MANYTQTFGITAKKNRQKKLYQWIQILNSTTTTTSQYIEWSIGSPKQQQQQQQQKHQ